MNNGIIEGKWNQLKGSFREKWGDITDDELQQAAGKKDRLVGLIQEKYGMTTEKAEAAYNKWYERAEEPDTWETIWNNVQGRWTELSGHFKQNYGQSVDDDLAQSRGRRDILAGMIQREYNVSRGEAFEMIDDWAYGSYRQPNIPSGGAR